MADKLTPFLISRRDLVRLFSSPRLVQRMVLAGWLQVVRRGKQGRETLYSYNSAELAFARYQAGEEPSLLPCELRARAVQTKGGAK